MPFIPIRDIDIYFELEGRGPRLLCISGTNGDLRRSPSIFETPLGRHFEILAYDQRGLGRTSRPDIPYSIFDYAADADALLQALGWDRCSVLGISFGGMVAQELALNFPQRVDRLVLACTSSGGRGGASYPLHELTDLVLDEYIRRTLYLSDTRRDADWQAANPDQFQNLFELVRAALAIGANEPGRQIGQKRQLEARVTHDTYDRLPTLDFPVLICGGLYDGIAPPDNLKALHKQIKRSRLELFEGGHLFFLQDPRAFESIKDFLLEELNT